MDTFMLLKGKRSRIFFFLNMHYKLTPKLQPAVERKSQLIEVAPLTITREIIFFSNEDSSNTAILMPLISQLALKYIIQSGILQNSFFSLKKILPHLDFKGYHDWRLLANRHFVTVEKCHNSH
ncbi:hypothetical protein KIL84_022657 [Mauremys mutica]|uniref:Uncharacterized protein n=1 Tax=Mauremys mutica TaxID=74926 RepID=A0A9D3WPS7_9SAUR|nr:hypothetical protein KIL84_022657 [Mauremys mutica]